MCAGMLREEDLGLEESKGPSLRIDLLSRRITKRVGIWLRESLLKGIASFVFPSGMLTSTCRFDVTSIKKKIKKTWIGPCFFFFLEPVFPLKVPVATCIVCLKVINQVYCIAVNLPVSFVPSTKCKKNASLKFCVHVKMKTVCLILYIQIV